MKIKLLLVPSLLTIIIILIIWFIYPNYTNGTDGVKENYAKLKMEREKLDQLEKKIQNVNALAAEIERKSTEKDTLFNYMPESLKEEEIIDNLNFLASASSLVVSNISVSLPKKTVEDTPITSAGTGIVALNPSGSAADSELPIAAPVPKPKELEVKFSVVGNYAAIKDLVAKIYRFKRYNDVFTAEIKRATTSEGSASGDSLQANLVLNFEFYPKSKEITDVDNAIFSKGNFDMAVIDKIRELTNVDVLKMQIDASGKENPFLP